MKGRKGDGEKGRWGDKETESLRDNRSRTNLHGYVLIFRIH